MKMHKKLIPVMLCFTLMCGLTPLWTSADVTAPTNLPALYVTLNNGADQSQITHDDYIAASYSLVGADGYDDIVNQPLEIKGRGNSTWSMEKKPYTLKLESKTNILGMGKAKKWNLLANYWDKTLMRNFLTLNLAKKCGLDSTPDCTFVDLYVNQNYCGNYLMTEKVEIGTNRVNIDGTNGGVMWEIERPYRHTDCTYCHQTASGVHLIYSDPKADDIGSDAMTTLMQTNNAFLDRLDSSMNQGYDEYSKYIDVDSFINWYIVNEFVKNFDSGFITSNYCYRDVDGKLFMGPCWDYDTCMGNQNVLLGLSPEGFRVNSSPWYSKLLDDPAFVGMLCARYTDLRKQGVFDDIINMIDTTKQAISASEALDLKKWPNAMSNQDMRGGTDKLHYTFDEEVTYLKDWMTKRVKWLDTQWNNDVMDGYFPISAVGSDTSIITDVSGNTGVNNETIDNLFDGKTNTKYCVPFDNGINVSFSTSKPTTITRYSFITANEDYSPVIPDSGYVTWNRNPTEWTIFGSNDGTNYIPIDVRTTNQDNNGNDIDLLPGVRFASTEFIISSPVAYSYYLVHFTGVNIKSDGFMQLSEIVLSEDDQSDLLSVKNAVNNFTGEVSADHLDDAYKIVENYKKLCPAKQYVISNSVNYDVLAENVQKVIDSIKPGDVDSSGKVDASDALLTLQGAVKKINLTDGKLYAADVDHNDLLTAVDALRILQYAVNKITGF